MTHPAAALAPSSAAPGASGPSGASASGAASASAAAEALGRSTGTGEPSAPPRERELLLARVPAERRRLFQLVRQLLDDLDEAAPWDDLYHPPDLPDAFLAMLAGLLGVVEGIPRRITELVDALSGAADDEETRAALEEAQFYFAGMHAMCSRDLERLRSLLAPHTSDQGPAPSPQQRNFLCEVAADLKGKYASALMGATASIVAQGQWSCVEVEPILFPERGEEGPRNERLVAALRRALEAIRTLPEDVPFADLLARWRTGARADAYALADLATFRGVLAQLLKRGLRRALYSGDYHHIQRRERALAARIAALEAAHLRTWSELPEEPGTAAATHRELVRLALEVAAIVDVDLLEGLVGARAIQDLRLAATTDRAAQQSGRPRRKSLPPELEPLVPLLGEEDLQTFLELLLGSVLKRASFAALRPAEPPPAAALEALPAISATLAAFPGAAPAAGSEPPGKAAGAATVLPTLPPTAATPEERRQVLGDLHDGLATLLAADNPQRSALRMLQRLLERHARIPPSMVQGAHPFVHTVLAELVPRLEAAARIGLVPTQARNHLVDCCQALTNRWLAPEQMRTEVPANLARLERLLEGLSAAVAAQLKNAR